MNYPAASRRGIRGTVKYSVSKVKRRTQELLTEVLNLLAAGKLREADRETVQVMYQAAGREKEGYLNSESIDNFPCEDLRIINQLWLLYSKVKFGFSVQKEIFECLGRTIRYKKEFQTSFLYRIGWRKGENDICYDELNFNLICAPRGHLPYARGVIGRRGEGLVECRFWPPWLFSRAKTCNL